MNEKFDEIIGRLAAQEPVLEDGEALTESIMAKLNSDFDVDLDFDRLTPTVPAKKSTSELKAGSTSRSTSTLRIFLRTFTSTAAVLLIIIYLWNGLDLWQNFDFPHKNQPKNNYEQCIAKYKSDYSFLEGATDLREAGARYLAKKKSHETIINYLKNKHYEVH